MLYIPGDIFSALEQGVDVFDGSCAYSATERGCAVVFPPVEDQAQGSTSRKVSGGPKSKGEEEGKADYEEAADSGAEVQPFEIDLNEER